MPLSVTLAAEVGYIVGHMYRVVCIEKQSDKRFALSYQKTTHVKRDTLKYDIVTTYERLLHTHPHTKHPLLTVEHVSE